ncbi:MAG: hypothetical protein OEL83_07505 [Desulforhopalus sp.]|nr:hypothetical protein [Desulforhopalus sp.]
MQTISLLAAGALAKTGPLLLVLYVGFHANIAGSDWLVTANISLKEEADG